MYSNQDNDAYVVSMNEPILKDLPVSSDLKQKAESIQSLSNTIGDPDYQSEAARQIITEVASTTTQNDKRGASVQKRSIPREKRRHNTAPHHVNMDSIEQMRKIESMKKSVSLPRILFRNINLLIDIL